MEFYTKGAALLASVVIVIISFKVFLSLVPNDIDNARFIPVLLVLLQSVPGDILELGANKYSTLVLSYIKTYQRSITTVDCDLEKITELSSIIKSQVPSSNQTFVCPKTMFKSTTIQNMIYNMNPSKYDKHWDKLNHKHNLFFGIVIINHIPYRRRWKDVVKFSDKAYVIVINDCNNTWMNRSKYGSMLFEAVSKFKYNYSIQHIKPGILIASNYIDVARILGPYRF